MKNFCSKFSLASLQSVILSLLLVVCAVACTRDESTPDNEGDDKHEVVEYSVPTTDAMREVSNYPAYVVPYEYTNFGQALVNRLQKRVNPTSEEDIFALSTVVFHSSQLYNLDENEWVLVLVQLLIGRNIIIIEPTINDFNNFCKIITEAFMELEKIEEGKEALEALDVIPGARQTLEAFYDFGNNPSKIESMFLSETDASGIFAEAIAVRGCDFHIVDRMRGVAETEVSHEQIVDETGKSETIETPNVDTSTGEAPSDAITPYGYGLFADMLTLWVNDHNDYFEQQVKIRKRGFDMINSRATETSKYKLDEISSEQKVQYTIMAATPYDVGPRLPVTVSFEICSIYMEARNCDYYCVYKKVLSYNQLLDCGPEEKRKWRQSENFGYEPDDTGNIYDKGWVAFDYYGPFMRDITGQSICHAHSEKFVDSTTTAVDLPSAESVERLDNVVVEEYSPKNSIGSQDKTSGFSYGFDGGLYLASEPSVNLGFSVSYDSSTTQTIDDLDITASTVNGVPEWQYLGQNLPTAHYNLFMNFSHTEAPSIMRVECMVDQSWIWCVPNPSGSYRLFDETKVTTSIMYYDEGFLQLSSKYANHATTKRVSFLMIPPPRCEQLWMMNVSPYSEQVNSMLSSTHSRFWNKDNHEFKLVDTSDDSRITIQQFINDFSKDLQNKKRSWQSRELYGPYTFTFYKVGDPDAVYELTFSAN